MGILWNSVHEYKEQALLDIKESADLLGSFDLQLDENYEQFVRGIYSQEKMDSWKIDKKIDTMFQSTDNRTVTVFVIDIDTSEQFYHEYKKKVVYKRLDDLKKSIREKYSKLVPVYFFDNVLHLTDDEQEFITNMAIVSEYTKNITENNIQVNGQVLKLVKSKNK